MDLSPETITISGDRFMKNKRRNHTAQFKAKVAFEAAKGDSGSVPTLLKKAPINMFILSRCRTTTGSNPLTFPANLMYPKPGIVMAYASTSANSSESA